MDLQTEKLGLIEWLVKQSDSNVIERIQKIKSENSNSQNMEREMTTDERSLLYRVQFLEERNTQQQDECLDFFEQYF